MFSKQVIRISIASVFVVAAALLIGCAASAGPYRPADASRRDTARAQELTAKAAELIFTDPEKAEPLLREALTADLYHGPAHNNLGVLYLNAGRLYEAASEFEWARKLMPGHPDPRLNLAMTLEEAGRIDEASEAYQTALEVYPNHLPTLMGLTRMQIRTGSSDDRTRENLKTIVMRSNDPTWRQWAERELIRLDQ
jgi:tetratricopeptide (TPR) repeat protein